MGIIRKSLAVGTLGVVHGSSKKQRVARQTMKNTAETTGALHAHTAHVQAMDRARIDADVARVKAEQEYRYATDPTYRAHVDAQALAAAEAARIHSEQVAAQALAAAEAARIRREEAAAQARAALTAVKKVAFAALLMLVMALLGLLVWLPQTVISKTRSAPLTMWRKRQLDGIWRTEIGWPSDVKRPHG